MAQEARPPYVTFERRAEEDRAASIEKGYYVTRDVDFVIITPSGGKNTVEKPVEEWLAQIRRASVEDPGRFPPLWVEHYARSYEMWKKGEELPETGTPIKGWAVLSPAQQAAVLHANIRTVEDLAQATEEGIAAIGMGGRTLKARAADWLTARGDGAGKTSAELEALRQKVADQTALIEQLQKNIAAIKPAQAPKPALQGG